MPKLTIEELRKKRESSKKSIYLREGKFRGKVTVHMGTCGIAAGAREIMNTFLDEFDNKDIIDIMLTSSGCAGLCSEEPMVTVEMEDSAPVKYGKLTPDKTKKIFNDHIITGNIVEEFVLGIGSERVG
ncbi:MAG: (2Fe-2S) ferredoxin domain-containing protein [Candidatus Marinimicrobia bacterium]|nr:(2Fe-2S) ferredoxin domain-containing protein [Candidatus Neomarinimicrobiota bacterium]MBL7046346.1 (2Fe-2S) ferredoxin domain-containing protein [Candidatus Neomarinimicrobiota bacterium]